MNCYQIVKNKIIKHPYIFLLLAVLYFFSIILLSQKHTGWMGDFYVYISIAQNMFSGGVLYKDAIDTKNMGFFFFFYYLVYLPYAKVFLNMQYFFIWQGIVLSIWYLLLAYLIYFILEPMYGTMKSLIGSIFCFVFLSYSDHSYFINQPQISIFFHLLLIYYILKTYEIQNYLNYFVYGVILGFCVSISTPYAALVLIVPILALMSFRNDHKFFQLVLRGFIAFLGFALVLTPFFLYFYFNDALNDWWYWNFTFATGPYSLRLSTYEKELQLNFFSKIGLKLWSIFAGSLIVGYSHLLGWIVHIMIYMNLITWILIGVRKYKKQPVLLSKKEVILSIVSSLCMISRFALIRKYSSYNIYLVPLIILQLPIVWRSLSAYAPRVMKFYKRVLISGIIIAVAYVPFRYFFSGSKVYYSKQIIAITLNNPQKIAPTIIAEHWISYVYSTRWKLMYYNFYHFLDHSFEEKVYALKPELLIIDSFSLENEINNNFEWLTYLYENYQQVTVEECCDTSNTRGVLFIRKDKVSTWNLL